MVRNTGVLADLTLTPRLVTSSWTDDLLRHVSQVSSTALTNGLIIFRFIFLFVLVLELLDSPSFPRICVSAVGLCAERNNVTQPRC